MAWLADIAGRAERLLESVDQVAAKSLHAEGEQGSSLAAATPSFSVPSSSTTVGREPGLQDVVAPRTAPAAARAIIPSVSSAPPSRPSTDDALIEFLNGSGRTSTNSTALSAAGSLQAKIPASQSVPQTPMAPSGVTAKRNLGTSFATATDTPVDSSALLLENRMLKTEIASLTDEVSSFSTKIRASQDMLSDMRAQLAATERREKQAYAAQKDAVAREEDARRKLAVSENELASTAKRLKDTESRIVEIQREKQSVLQDHSFSAEAQANAFAAMKDELAEAVRELNAERALREATKTSLEARVKELQVVVDEANSTASMSQRQADESKGDDAVKCFSFTTSAQCKQWHWRSS